MMMKKSYSPRSRQIRGTLRQLEPLEARTLLSAAIQVTGNGIAIANHEAAPAIAAFTDFGPMSTRASAAIGKVSRSFVIADAGTSDLTLTGGLARQIRITGANAGDFVLTATAASSIPAGQQSGFTITFAPRGAGLRRAVVTILSNDPATPSYTFNIQGTGLATTTAADGLQVGTSVKGTGLGAVTGAAITFNYNGFLLNSEFASTLQVGGAPLVLTLGVSGAIPGWTQGLAGIKAGETRLLVMPASLGYGASANGNIPAGASLIYQVTAVSVANPVALITGNDIPIAFNDRTPSAADGTFLGATVAGSNAPLAFTFKIANGSAGILTFPIAPVVVLATKSPANFTASNVTIDPTSTFAMFTVTYTPTKAGTQTAIVHVRSSDPLHHDYTFTVSATATPFVDLSVVTIGTAKIPVSGNIISGSSTLYKVPVTVTNLGNAAVPGATPPVLVEVYMQDTTTGVDTLISSQTTTNLRGTGSGKAKLINMNVRVPATVPTGSYQLLVKVDGNAALAETNFSNNSALSAQVINVTQGFFNVNGTLGASTFPTAIASGLALTGRLNVVVRNAGNLALPGGQKFVLQVLAHPVAGADTVLGVSTITLSAWAPGKSAQFAVATKFPGGLPTGQYVLEAQLTPLQPLTESSSTDNLVTTNALGGDLLLTVS